MKTHYEIINLLKDSNALAGAIGVSEAHARVIWHRIKNGGKLPVAYWRPFVNYARANGLPVDYTMMVMGAVRKKAA